MELSATPRMTRPAGLGRQHPSTADAAYRSIYSRLLGLLPATNLLRRDRNGHARLITCPPLHRTSMAPDHWRSKPHSENLASPQGRLRRTLLLLLVASQTILASGYMLTLLPGHIGAVATAVSLLLFSILFAWISAGFWTAVMGFLLLLHTRADRAASSLSPDRGPIPTATRTAIVMPICNENVQRLFAGLRATYDTLAQTGDLGQFDFFILSDSRDPDCRVAEQMAWLDWLQEPGSVGRVFYRWRRHQQKHKSGNIADFCRRWGKDYKYLIVLDADSVMSGDCIISLVQRMEANSGVGIMQTSPRAVGRDTLYARVQQFASHVYGPLLIAGLHFWQLGESHYWGHNAIIRVAPFIRHCGLGRLPGKGALSGDILSHDFAEAALMRRAGWQVWIAHDLPGSYEEVPSNLVEELQRDRRWCQGNLMNLRLLLIKGLHPVHRAIFVIGAQSYISASLWLASLLLTTGLLTHLAFAAAAVSSLESHLLTRWQELYHDRAVVLFAATALMLILPKLLGLVLAMRREPQRLGGWPKLIVSTFAEIIVSMLLAPVRMVFHSYFVSAGLLGKRIRWKSPEREDAALGWRETCRVLGPCTALGLVWGLWLGWVNIRCLWWYLPIIVALLMAIPLAVASSRTTSGMLLRRLGLFRIPEESLLPQELQAMQQHWQTARPLPAFRDAVYDPYVNAIACACGSARPTQRAASAHLQRKAAIGEALNGGADKLSQEQKHMLLNDPLALALLHDLSHAHAAHPALKIAAAS